jgi:CheY-like chemotaxis protein
MDGIEATRIIRDMGYTHSIIALTANALIGRETMFLQNGFDGFISKPIDSREMNHTLNEFIRNKKPSEVVNAARREQQEKALKNLDASEQSNDNEKHSEMVILFIQDAEKAMKVLNNSYEKLQAPLSDSFPLNDSELKIYITTVHGLKSILAILEEKELSEFALRLENAGEERNLAVMQEETPAFMEKLQALVTKFKPTEEKNNVKISGEDAVYLREKLLEIKASCASFDWNSANTALEELRSKKWPNHIDNIINDIALQILHSAFKKAEEAIDKFISRASPVRGQLIEW